MRRVVITGIGIVSSLGFEIEEFWNKLLAGDNVSNKPINFKYSGRYRSKINTVVDYENLLSHFGLSNKDDDELNLCAKIGLIASRQALADAGLTEYETYKNAGISVGTTSGGDMDYFAKWLHYGEKINRGVIKNCNVFSSMTNIAEELGIEGPVCTVSSACTSGTISLAYAYEVIKNSDADIMLAGGCDVLREVDLSGFNCLRVLSQEDCRPFSADRTGMIIGDGSAFMVLEDHDSALKRNAKILAEIKGVGFSCDAYHPTAPNSKGAVAAMRAALDDANLDVSDIQYVNCHGTGTKLNDAAEIEALNTLFGEHAANLYATSAKSSLGHLLGTAGSIESVIIVLVLNKNTIPPMINCASPDKKAKFKLVNTKNVNINASNVIKNSFGFGGNNVSVIFSKYLNK